MLKVKVKSASKSRETCNESASIAYSDLAGCSSHCNDKIKLSDASQGFTGENSCTRIQPHGVPESVSMYVINKPTPIQVNDLSKMETSCTNTISGRETLLQSMEEFQRDNIVPLAMINVEPMDDQQNNVEEHIFVQYDRSDVIDDMGISETVEVGLPYTYPAPEGQDGCEKSSVNVQFGDTQQEAALPENMTAVAPEGNTCHSNVVVEKITYEMPLIKAEAAGGGADFESEKLVQGYTSTAVVYPQDMSAVQWSVCDDNSVLHQENGGHPVEKISSTGRLMMEKHRTITIKDVTNCGKKKLVSPLQKRKTVANCPVTPNTLTDTIIIVSPKPQTMTPLQVQHPTLTHLLEPFVSNTPTPTVCVFDQTHENRQCSPPHIPPDPMVANVATLTQLEKPLAISGSQPGGLVIIERHDVENQHAEYATLVSTPQKGVSSTKLQEEEVVCSLSRRKATSITATPTRTDGCRTLVTVSATDATTATKTTEPDILVASGSSTLNPETNKALKMLLSKVSHEQQREINVVDLVAESCNGIGKPPETLADRYMKNWKQTGQFQCKFCPYSSVTRNYLYRHWMANHSSVMPYQCHHCDMKASSRDIITRHQTVVHRSSVKSVLIDSMLEQQTIDQFDEIFNASFGRDGLAGCVDQSAVGSCDTVDAKKVKREDTECSNRRVIGVSQSGGFCGVDVKILAGRVDQKISVICNTLANVSSQSSLCSGRTQDVKSEHHSSPLQHEPGSFQPNPVHLPSETEHTNVVSNELSVLSTDVVVTQDTHVDVMLGITEKDVVIESSSTQGPKPEHLQEQMMAALHSCTGV